MLAPAIASAALVSGKMMRGPRAQGTADADAGASAEMEAAAAESAAESLPGGLGGDSGDAAGTRRRKAALGVGGVR